MIGDAIAGKKIRDETIEISESSTKLIRILDTLSSWIDDIKPVEQQQRFGNKAFRDWHNKLCNVSFLHSMETKSTFLPYHVKKNHSTFVVDTLKVMLLPLLDIEITVDY